MHNGYGGSPSRTVSTMSLSVRPIRRLTSRSITRSQSFTGFNISDTPNRNLSVFSNPGLRRKPSRLLTMSTPPPKVPHPERLDEVYKALKKGLGSYLQIHQVDLDCLGRQTKESKRNSRLGFLYELDKQVKVNERFIRRLEFHLSKTEELYEAYCLQRRLKDGANKMVMAYTASSGSKEARESLAEANKGYKEYTENMCVLENQLESQLGEFHIKMKGLAGFARLCAGDQYEIFLKYGRQRWKLRGRIEINAKQVWDSEDMVFLPHINEYLFVKVTELKSLANHVVVGNVCCETKDLFAALPQTVAVDVNDLGTIKLSLEVTWNPFDKDEHVSMVSTVTKPPMVSKRFSTIFNHSPPGTPSLREQAFYNMLRLHEELDNGTVWSNSSESSDESSSPQLSAGGQHNSTHHKVAVVSPVLQSGTAGTSYLQPDPAASTPNTTQNLSSASVALHITKDEGQSKRDERNVPVTTVSKVEQQTSSYALCTPSCSLSDISEIIADDIINTDRSPCQLEAISINDNEKGTPQKTTRAPSSLCSSVSPGIDVSVEHKEEENGNESTELYEVVDLNSPAQINTHLPEETNTETYVAHLVSVEDETQCVDTGLGEALGALVSSLDDYRGQFSQVQLLEEELRLLQVTLKGVKHSCSPSMDSLNVEMALGSFDFLNISDWEEEEEEKGEKRSRNDRSVNDAGWASLSLPTSPLTTGNSCLDRSLVEHLKSCTSQLQRVGMFGPLRCGEIYALDRLLREARVLKIIRHISKDNRGRLTQVAEVIPQLDQCQGAVSLWQKCVDDGDIFSVSAETFVATLERIYSTTLPERTANMADTVFLFLVERVVDQRLPRRCSNRDKVMVTVFQLWNYVEANGISNMNTHITELAFEVWFVQSLASGDQEVIVHTLRRSPDCSLKREGVHAVAKLLKDPRGKVSASASSLLRSLASQPKHRERALVSCLELLEDENVDTRVCGCKALACLKAKESIDQLVYLCQTDKVEVRDAAKQALLVLGEEGKMAHQRAETSQDSISRLFAPGSMASTAF
ncbi:rho family-interacting cell polarization regulator 1-like [Genypterus blacodes]|uniref:rho family-interacting cell polarization regulator 1-like n=1 Tax=Genypterus blacodes TaxID=154954 RepID=UPI003F775ED4